MSLEVPHLNHRQRLGLGGAVLLALGAAGGAGAVSLTRPAVEMAPTVVTPVAKLAASTGTVSVRGRVAGVYGNSFMIEDASGRTLVDAGRGTSDLRSGAPVLVQGRFDDGKLRARFMVDGRGNVEEVGGPGPRHGPGRDGPPPPPPGGPNAAPPPPPGGPGAPPPPPPGGPGAPGTMPPPTAGGAMPPPPPVGMQAPAAAPVSAPAPR
jgi:hypothetical protein